MEINQSIEKLKIQFPFINYVESPATSGAYQNIATTVRRYLKPGSTILDFGCGPMDKTSILQFMGYSCYGFDDLADNWHLENNNREKIISFAKEIGIDFRLADQSRHIPFEANFFDMIMAHDVLEHLHSSPCDLLNKLVEFLKPGGFLFITVPNAVNIRKRIDVMRGKTNLPPFESFYWSGNEWRGYIREYVYDDLNQLAQFLKLEVVELRGCDHMLQKVPKKFIPLYKTITNLFQGWKDSWTLVARKPENWQSQLQKLI